MVIVGVSGRLFWHDHQKYFPLDRFLVNKGHYFPHPGFQSGDPSFSLQGSDFLLGVGALQNQPPALASPISYVHPKEFWALTIFFIIQIHHRGKNDIQVCFADFLNQFYHNTIIRGKDNSKNQRSPSKLLQKFLITVYVTLS